MLSEADLGFELNHYRLGVVDLVLHDWAEGTTLYTTAGETTEASVVAEHDGPAVYEGEFREFIADGTIVEAHPHAGYCGAWTHRDELDSPATLLVPVDTGGERGAE